MTSLIKAASMQAIKLISRTGYEHMMTVSDIRDDINAILKLKLNLCETFQ